MEALFISALAFYDARIPDRIVMIPEMAEFFIDKAYVKRSYLRGDTQLPAFLFAFC